MGTASNSLGVEGGHDGPVNDDTHYLIKIESMDHKIVLKQI